MTHQGETDAGASVWGFDEQVFKEDVPTRLEGVECVVEEGESDGGAIGAQFLAAFKPLIENPLAMLL